MSHAGARARTLAERETRRPPLWSSQSQSCAPRDRQLSACVFPRLLRRIPEHGLTRARCSIARLLFDFHLPLPGLRREPRDTRSASETKSL
ncbi:hypothetical protein MRX96_058635 [Rhipicephalus microplus]